MTNSKNTPHRNPYEKKILEWEMQIQEIAKEINTCERPSLFTGIKILLSNNTEQKFKNWEEKLLKIKAGLLTVVENINYIQDNEELINNFEERIFNLRTKINFLIKTMNKKNPKNYFF